jgi:hypothetical protein
LLAALHVFAGAGIAGNGHALAAGERISVARQFESGARSVAAIQQPAQVAGGGAQRGKLPGGKEPFVLGRQAPVCLMTGHGKRLAQRGPKIIFGFRSSFEVVPACRAWISGINLEKAG